MEISLKEFKERFADGFLEVHWRQWSALGVASHVRPEEKRLIDLEALALSTLTLGLEDTRLLNAAVEWLIKYGEWLNLPRLKRIAKIFMRPLPEEKTQVRSLIEPPVFELLGNTLQRFDQKRWTAEKSGDQELREASAREYETFFSNFQMRGIVTEPVLQRPSLLQLRLRGIFGIDARAEVLIYLMSHEGGNSNAIAKEVFYVQKNVYRILEKWHKAGFLTKVKGPKAGAFIFERKNEWLNALGLRAIPTYLNWVQIFLFFNQIVKVLSVPPWSEDEYVLSSLFRDALNDVKRLGGYLDISVPEPDQFPGASYFSPFALKILEMVERLK
ncbi:MAG: hypothetical protein JRI46_10680 [Deltaproteobacteria bacterium]|nr:hypothetical protein [Deltaproteobacteria bacterium]